MNHRRVNFQHEGIVFNEKGKLIISDEAKGEIIALIQKVGEKLPHGESAISNIRDITIGTAREAQEAMATKGKSEKKTGRFITIILKILSGKKVKPKQVEFVEKTVQKYVAKSKSHIYLYTASGEKVEAPLAIWSREEPGQYTEKDIKEIFRSQESRSHNMGNVQKKNKG